MKDIWVKIQDNNGGKSWMTKISKNTVVLDRLNGKIGDNNRYLICLKDGKGTRKVSGMELYFEATNDEEAKTIGLRLLLEKSDGKRDKWSRISDELKDIYNELGVSHVY